MPTFKAIQICSTCDDSKEKGNLIFIKQNTSKGYAELISGGVFDTCYPSSKTRRGRVQDKGNTCPTLTVAGIDGIVRMEKKMVKDGYEYRIRKLTPRECWRLMDFDDNDFEKAEKVNSNTQLYKQAGNAIVRNCLVAIMGQMIEGKENLYKEINNDGND